MYILTGQQIQKLSKRISKLKKLEDNALCGDRRDSRRMSYEPIKKRVCKSNSALSERRREKIKLVSQSPQPRSFLDFIS